MESTDFNSNNSNLKDKNNIGRFALSKNICRFELPMDMKEFESKYSERSIEIQILKYLNLIFQEMDPVKYLEKYCKVNDRRKALYRRVFDRYKIKADGQEFLDMKVSVH